jgi:acyl carrier protein
MSPPSPPLPAGAVAALDDAALRAEVLEVARRALGLSDEQLAGLTPTAELGSRLDSLQRLSLVVALEDHFGLCFEPEDDEQARTLDEVLRVLRARAA